MIGIGANLAYQPTVTRYRSGAALEYLFADEATINPREGSAPIACVRSGATATRFNSAGQLEIVAANIARLDHDPATLRFENMLTYSRRFDNASAWGKGATLSNFFTVTDDAALGPFRQVDATKFVSTATTSQGLFLRGWPPATVPVGSVTPSIWIYMPTQVGVTSWAVLFDAQDVESATTAYQTVFDKWVRVSAPMTIASARTFLDFNIRYNGGTTPSAAGFTFYASRAQINTGGALLDYQETGASAFAKWYACKGLLVEEARRSDVRNNTMAGAVAGTPGTEPTNWSLTSTTSGITRSIVGFGGEEGIDYIDVSYVGTASATVNFFIQTDSATGQAASSGQTWTSSAYIRKIAGNNPSTLLIATSGRAATTGAPLETATLNITPTFAALATQRFEKAITLANASTAHIVQYLHVGAANGEVVNVTLRIGLPQLEQGAFATSAIKTFGAAVTRNRDNPSITNASLYVNRGTLTTLLEYELSGTPVAPGALVIDNGTVNERIALRVGSALGGTPGSNDLYIQAGGITVADTAGTQLQINMAYKSAFAVQANDAALYTNGALGGTDAGMAMPTGLSTITIGDTGFCGRIKRLAIFATRRTNADLAQLTA